MSLIPTMNLRFEKRMAPVPEPHQRIGGGSILAPRFVLQQMFFDCGGRRQIWVDVPTVEAKEPNNV